MAPLAGPLHGQDSKLFLRTRTSRVTAASPKVSLGCAGLHPSALTKHQIFLLQGVMTQVQPFRVVQGLDGVFGEVLEKTRKT